MEQLGGLDVDAGAVERSVHAKVIVSNSPCRRARCILFFVRQVCHRRRVLQRSVPITSLIALLSLGTCLDVMGQEAANEAGRLANQTCDRACLNGFVDRYLDAVVAHNPSGLSYAPLVKFTENGQKLELGDGFWRTATGRGTYQLYVDDIEAGEVGFMGTLREANTPVMVAIRLKIDRHEISQIETIIIRNAQQAANLEKLGSPNRRFLEAIPQAGRSSRIELIQTANKYFSALQLNDGKGDYSFFADDCNRVENGTLGTNNPAAQPTTRPGQPVYMSTAWSCKKQFQAGFYHFVTRIRNRRFLVVDPERGLALAFAFFDHAAGNTRSFQLPDGRVITEGPVTPWTWEIAELFKVQNGKIQQIEAEFHQVPYGMGSGWDSWENSMSTAPIF